MSRRRPVSYLAALVAEAAILEALKGVAETERRGLTLAIMCAGLIMLICACHSRSLPLRKTHAQSSLSRVARRLSHRIQGLVEAVASPRRGVAGNASLTGGSGLARSSCKGEACAGLWLSAATGDEISR